MALLSVDFRTSRNLHSHYHEAPLTRKHYQVTGYGIVSEPLRYEQDVGDCGAWLRAMRWNPSSPVFWNGPSDWRLHRDSFLTFGNVLAKLAVGKAAYEVCLFPSLASHNNHAIFMF